MTHDPEQLAAAYLTGMRPRARRRFEAHLLACERCWHEVSLAHRGRDLAEAAREPGPPQLRDDIRVAVTAAAARPIAASRPIRRTVTGVAATVAVLTAAVVVVLVRPWQHSPPAGRATPPGVIAAAMASYSADRLPGTAVPAQTPPALAPLSLRVVGAAAGQLDGVPVTMFAYRTPSGTRLTIILSSRPFPEAAQAHELGGAESAWTMHSGHVTLICAQGTHAMLLLGSDATLVNQAGALLNAI